MNRKNNILNNSSVKRCVSSVYLCVITFLQFIYKNKQHIKLRSSVFGLLTFITLQTNAQVTIQTDTTKIRIGEQIQLKYLVDKQDGVQFPKLVLDSLKKVEVVKSFSVDTVKNQLIKKYLLTSFDSGRYQLPEQLISIKGKIFQTKPITIDVGTVAVDTTKQKLFPIKAIQHQKLDVKDYAKNYWYILPILVALGFLIWYFFIRKKETEEERYAKLPPFEMAIQQLEQLDKKLLWQNNKTKEYYSELTDILRTYMEKELKIPALESTTSELVNTLKKFKNESGLDISNKTIIKLKDLLQEADLVKFAKSKPYSDEIQMHRKYADTILEGLKFEEEVVIKDQSIPLCPITNEEITDEVLIQSWKYRFIFFKFQKEWVKVSAKGKELHLKQESYVWRISNKIANILSFIPFFNGTLILIWLISASPLLLLIAIIEFFIKKTFLNRGVVYFKNDHIKIKDLNQQDIDNVTFKSSEFRKKLTTLLTVIVFLFPIVYFGYLFTDTYNKNKSEIEFKSKLNRLNTTHKDAK